MNWRVCGLPAADDASAMLLATAVTYFATLPVTDHRPSPVGSNTTPSRGLHASSVMTVAAGLILPAVLVVAQRRDWRSADPLTRQASLKNTECVRKFEPALSTRIGFHWMMRRAVAEELREDRCVPWMIVLVPRMR